MKETPILFCAEMVRAYFDGRKGQTRRLPKEQPAHWCHGSVVELENGILYACDEEWKLKCPYGMPGDKLWGKETFCYISTRTSSALNYRADGEMPEHARKNGVKWTPSIFMRRGFSRINPKITKIRFERLHEITEQDAIDEGVTMLGTSRSSGEACRG